MIERSFRIAPEAPESFESLVLAAKQRREPGWEKKGQAALAKLFHHCEKNLQFVAASVARSVGRGHDELFIEDCLGDAQLFFVEMLDSLNLERLPAEALKSAFYNDRLAAMVRTTSRRRMAAVSVSEHADLTVGRVRRREESIGRELADFELHEFSISRSTLSAARAALSTPVSLEAEDKDGVRMVDLLEEDSADEPVHDLEAVLTAFEDLPARFQFILEAYCGRHGEEYAGNFVAVAALFCEVTGREIGERRIRQWFSAIVARMRGRLGFGAALSTGVSVDDRESSEIWDVLTAPHLRGFGADEETLEMLLAAAR